jgi:hypothetical protein
MIAGGKIRRLAGGRTPPSYAISRGELHYSNRVAINAVVDDAYAAP